MKKILLTLAILVLTAGSTVMAQEVKPKFEKEGNLIKGTFYYENGAIKQEGTYKNGKLHGEWISYNQNGEKNAVAKYQDGNKTGKWFFWSNDILTEVDYSNNTIAEVTTYKNTGSLAIRD